MPFVIIIGVHSQKFILISVIKVDRPFRNGYSQPASPYGQPCRGLPSLRQGIMGSGTPYRTHSIMGSVGQPTIALHNPLDNNQSFSSGSSFEYAPPESTLPAVPQTAMMMQPTQSLQPIGVMQQHQQQILLQQVLSRKYLVMMC